jgi:peptidoglycan DL-endopeptidase CwlO
LSVVTAAAATAASVAVIPGSASAQTVAQVKAEIDQLNSQAEKATNAYDAATEQIANLRAQVNQLQATIATEQSGVSALETTLGTMAAAQYRGSGVDSTLQLMLSEHPDAFLQQSTTLTELTSQETATLTRLKSGVRQLQQNKVQAAQEVAQITSTEKALTAEKSTIQSELNQAQALLNSLTPTQRASVEGAAYSNVNVNAPAPNARIATVLAYVKSKLGDAYVYGANGPTTFDCSGLIQAAFAAAGVSLPRTTYEMYAALPHISYSQLQPGDLVFVDGNEHMGIYVGNGMAIHAPHTGTVVQYVPVQYLGSFYGAARVP